jgi:hypothetical protein
MIERHCGVELRLRRSAAIDLKFDHTEPGHTMVMALRECGGGEAG